MRVSEGYKRCVECNLDAMDGIESAENSSLAAYLCPECCAKLVLLFMQRHAGAASNSPPVGVKEHLGGSWQKVVPAQVSEKIVLSEIKEADYFVAWSQAEQAWSVKQGNGAWVDRARFFWDEKRKTNVYGPYSSQEEAEAVRAVIER